MNLEKRINAFSALGEIIRDSCAGINSNSYSVNISRATELQQFRNPWFTPGNVRTALKSLAGELTAENLRKWTSSYPDLDGEHDSSIIGLICAGNIPMAGFHDFLSVLISGRRLVAKTSSRDPDLLPLMNEILCSIEPEFTGYATFTTGTLSGFDAVIATGSNNSARYFDYYFGKYPHIIRKNRNSIAILDGNETSVELELLGNDIFTYFGLGCRSVSKIYLPEKYDVGSLAQNWKAWTWCIDHSRYANNYDYNKAIFLVNREQFHDAGFVILKNDKRLSSPVSVVHYEFYTSKETLREEIGNHLNNIQCITGNEHTPFGYAQMPHLWDYADGTDTIDFLLKKNTAGIL